MPNIRGLIPLSCGNCVINKIWSFVHFLLDSKSYRFLSDSIIIGIFTLNGVYLVLEKYFLWSLKIYSRLFIFCSLYDTKTTIYIAMIISSLPYEFYYFVWKCQMYELVYVWTVRLYQIVEYVHMIDEELFAINVSNKFNYFTTIRNTKLFMGKNVKVCLLYTSRCV